MNLVMKYSLAVTNPALHSLFIPLPPLMLRDWLRGVLDECYQAALFATSVTCFLFVLSMIVRKL
jgi:hypothetical protein